jgi:hypothetical protein
MRIQRAPRGERDHHLRYAEGEPHVLTDDVAREVRQSDQLRQPPQVGSQQRDVCPTENDLVEVRAVGDAHVRAAQRWRIIDAVADHHHRMPGGLLGAHDLELLGRQHVGDDFIDAKHFTHFTRGGGAIARR